MNWLVQAIGTGLVLLALADIFLTVLYPRSGKGVISTRLSKGMWQLFRFIARASFWDRNRLLSYCGPILLVTIVLVWILLLIIGFACIFWPALGFGIQTSQGETQTDFGTALYYSGYMFTTLGVGNLVPETTAYRLLAILEAAVGFSTFTLTLTYFLSVYSALTRRNAFALSLQYRSASQANAAEMLARLGAHGDFSGARQEIANIATELLNLLELHHSYPVLHYFRFEQPFYSLARITLLSLDTAALTCSALDEEQYVSLIRSAAISELGDGGQLLLIQLSDTFLPRRLSSGKRQSAQVWRVWYYRAVDRLQAEGIAHRLDLQAGAEQYIALRQKWNPYVAAFADYMAYDWQEIAPAEGTNS